MFSKFIEPIESIKEGLEEKELKQLYHYFNIAGSRSVFLRPIVVFQMTPVNHAELCYIMTGKDSLEKEEPETTEDMIAVNFKYF